MRSTPCKNLRVLSSTLLLLAGAGTVHATPLISNGGFETGFTGWTLRDGIGSDGSFVLQSGTASPVNGDPVPAPPEGSAAAMTDAGGPGSHVLYQDFVVPAQVPSATLSFDLFVGNRGSDFYVPNPASLDFGIAAFNQQARVDILLGNTDPFSVVAGDVLLNLYQTLPGNPLVAGYSTISADVTGLLAAHAGETLRLRFAETDNEGIFQLGVDRVGLTVPEPATVLLLGAGLAGMRVSARRLRKSTRNV